MSDIKISYVWDEHNFNKLFKEAYDYQFKNSPRRFIGWLFIALAQFGVVAALKKGNIALLLFSTILIVYWYFIKKIIVKKRAHKEFLNSPLKDKKIELTAGDNGIKQGNRLLSWEEIEKIVPIQDDIFIFTPAKSYYIPFNGFKSIEDKNRFKQLAKEKGKLQA